jgi:hypothetical protein
LGIRDWELGNGKWEMQLEMELPLGMEIELGMELEIALGM